MASGTTNCPNCKNPITRTSTFCTVCGYVFSQTVPPPQRTFQQPQIGGQQPIYKGRQPVQPHTNPTAFVPNPTSGSPGSFSTKGLFGWCSVSGTVIDVSQPYQIRPQGSSVGCLISLLLLPVLIFVVPSLLLAMVFITVPMKMFNMFGMGKPRGHPGFFENLLRQITGAAVNNWFANRRDPVWVRDVRLRDPSGQQHVVRVQGDIVSGSVSIGDDVDLEGYDRGGTLFLSRGWNRSVNAKIKIKRR